MATHCRSLFVTVIALFVAVALANTPVCTDFRLLVTASSNNVNVSDPTLTQTFPVQGTFNLSARYCEPTISDLSPKRTKTLLIGQHGVTYSKIYWDIPLHRETYSFVVHAAQEGFPTLIYDLLGHGQSDRPDPSMIVQPALHVAIATEISKMARQGKITPACRSFNKVVFLGHSYGSQVANGMIANSPDAADAVVLTGISHTEGPAAATVPGEIATFLPAAQADPARFAGLNAGYLTNSNQTDRFRLFYDPDTSSFDNALLTLDENTRDTIALGEAILFQSLVVSAPNYRKPVLLANGREDILYCTQNADDPSTIHGDCGQGPTSIPAMEKQFFPNSKFSWAVIENSGHSINWHFVGPQLYAKIFTFLTSNGF